MDKVEREKIKECIKNFKMPRYKDLPTVGLFLDQVVKYINGILDSLGVNKITASMISNYVKMKIIKNPVDKTYDRNQIAYLIYISIVKSIFSLDDISTMIKMLYKFSYTTEICYDYFCDEFENVLLYVFELKPNLDSIGNDKTEEKKILRNAIMALAHKVFLTKHLSLYKF